MLGLIFQKTKINWQSQGKFSAKIVSSGLYNQRFWLFYLGRESWASLFTLIS
jgi:hypothetical protein